MERDSESDGVLSPSSRTILEFIHSQGIPALLMQTMGSILACSLHKEGIFRVPGNRWGTRMHKRDIEICTRSKRERGRRERRTQR